MPGKITRVCFVICLSCFLAACSFAGSLGEDTAHKEKTAKGMKIGVCISDMTHTTFIEMLDQMHRKADKLGVEIIEFSSDSDPGNMVEGLENFIAAGCDAIIFQNFDQDASEYVVSEAVKKGIIVISYDNYSDAATYVYVADNEKLGFAIGHMAGDWINENLGGRANVAICDYSLINFLNNRADYIEEGIRERAPESKIVARQDAGLLDQGVNFGEILLQAHPDVNVVAGVNDNGVLGVKEAFESAHKTGPSIAMFGCDATEEGIKAIREDSVFRGTVYFDLKQAGEDMFMAAVNAYLGDPGEKRVVTFQMVPIMKDNLDIVK